MIDQRNDSPCTAVPCGCDMRSEASSAESPLTPQGGEPGPPRLVPASRLEALVGMARYVRDYVREGED